MGGTYGASLSMSSSSGASLSGATEASGGGVYGGIAYGPGSVVKVPEGTTRLSSTFLLLGLAAAGAAAYFMFKN